MHPHGRRGEKHDVHVLQTIHSDERLAQHQQVAKEEGADKLAGPTIDDLGVDLGLLVIGKVDELEFAGLAGASGDADGLRPIKGARVLVKKHPIGRCAFFGISGHVNHRSDAKVSGLGEDEMLGEIHLASQRFPSFDGHLAKHRIASWCDGVALAIRNDEIQPLRASVAGKGQILTCVVGDGEDGKHGLTGEKLLFPDAQGGCQLRMGRADERE